MTIAPLRQHLSTTCQRTDNSRFVSAVAVAVAVLRLVPVKEPVRGVDVLAGPGKCTPVCFFCGIFVFLEPGADAYRINYLNINYLRLYFRKKAVRIACEFSII